MKGEGAARYDLTPISCLPKEGEEESLMGVHPFSEGDTVATFRNVIEKTIREIMELDNHYVLKASPAELENHYVNKVTITPIDLRTREFYIANHQGTEIDVSHDFRRAVFRGERAVVRGTKIDIAIPFEGDPFLWKLRASTFSLGGYPEITVQKDSIVFSVAFPDDSPDPQRLKQEIDREIASLRDAVQYLRRDVETHNAAAPGRIRSAIEAKRKLASSAIGAVAALGIPIRRADQPPTFAVPAKRRPSPIPRPKVPAEPYQPDPTLLESEYQHILNVMKSMATVIERNPGAFATLEEEAIRTHFLLQLNGHYEGGATGETFNAAGKTDILIRAQDRNAFIAECKFWHGPKAFSQAVDQLLGYLSWRDTKCAILVFNKARNSSEVRRKMHEVMKGRAEHRRTVTHDPNGDSRYIFVKESDPGKEIIITTQLYDIPGVE